MLYQLTEWFVQTAATGLPPLDQVEVPIIVGVKDCTRLLRTGETVELDAAKGVITPLKV